MSPSYLCRVYPFWHYYRSKGRLTPPLHKKERGRFLSPVLTALLSSFPCLKYHGNCNRNDLERSF